MCHAIPEALCYELLVRKELDFYSKRWNPRLVFYFKSQQEMHFAIFVSVCAQKQKVGVNGVLVSRGGKSKSIGIIERWVDFKCI